MENPIKTDDYLDELDDLGAFRGTPIDFGHPHLPHHSRCPKPLGRSGDTWSAAD